MCLVIYISSWKSLFKYESCFLSIKKLSLHLVSRGNVEGIIFFNLTIVEDKHISFFFCSYLFLHRSIHLVQQQQQK